MPGISMARKYSRVAELHATPIDSGRRGTLDPRIAGSGPWNGAKSRYRRVGREFLHDEFEKTRPAGEKQRGKTSHRKNTSRNTVQSQGRRPPAADQLQGPAAKTPGI